VHNLYPFHRLAPDQNVTPLPHLYYSSYHAAQSFGSIARLVVAVLAKVTAREIQPGDWRSTLVQEASGKISKEVLVCRFM